MVTEFLKIDGLLFTLKWDKNHSYMAQSKKTGWIDMLNKHLGIVNRLFRHRKHVT